MTNEKGKYDFWSFINMFFIEICMDIKKIMGPQNIATNEIGNKKISKLLDITTRDKRRPIEKMAMPAITPNSGEISLDIFLLKFNYIYYSIVVIAAGETKNDPVRYLSIDFQVEKMV